MELRRHIDKWLQGWKELPEHKPALIRGVRQSGKTHSIRLFAENNYQVVIYLNFWDRPDLIDVFDGELDIDTILRELSVKIPMPELIEGDTVFLYDEVQECPRALLSLKTVMNDNRFDFIASGSYLGVNGYVISDDTPKPVGCTDEFDMRIHQDSFYKQNSVVKIYARRIYFHVQRISLCRRFSGDCL